MQRENTNSLPPFWTHKEGVYENILSSHKTRTRPAVCRGGILAGHDYVDAVEAANSGFDWAGRRTRSASNPVEAAHHS